jgi:DNA-binding PadR family transcriptional regulator
VTLGPPRLGAAEEEILRQLADGKERYGLLMVEKSAGKLKRGTIYVVLHRLEDGKGLVESREERDDERSPGQRGLPRRLYRITGDGARALRAWDMAQAAWGGAVLA